MSFVENSTTLDDIANWAAVGKLKRADLLPDAREAAADIYKVVTKKVPFDYLRATSSELPMVAGQVAYDLGALLDLAGDVKLAGICSLRMTYGTNKFRRLRRSNVRVYDSLGSITSSIPATYSRWGGTVEFNPAPASSAYTWRLRYWTQPTLSSPVEATILRTPPEWDELFKWETLYRMLIHVDEYDKAQALVNPVPMPRQSSPKKTIMFETAIIPRLWNDLLITIDQRENVDEDFSINPQYREYTSSRR